MSKKPECQRYLFGQFSGKMMSVCLRYANDEQQAQDILQDGFIRVFQYIHQYRFEGSFEGWMRRIFVNVATRSVAIPKLQFSEMPLADTTEHSIDPTVLEKISADEIHRFIRQMPPGYRMVFNLYAIEGYSHEEIAEMLGIQSTTSRGQLLKARKHLQALILKKHQSLQT